MTVTPDIPVAKPTDETKTPEPSPEPTPEPEAVEPETKQKPKFNPKFDNPILMKCDELFGRNRGPSGSGRYTALQLHQAIEVLKVKKSKKDEGGK